MKNVTFSGGQFESANGGSKILGNLTITGSQCNPGAGDLNGFWSECSGWDRLFMLASPFLARGGEVGRAAGGDGHRRR